MVEIWKDIPGYEGLYQVSNLGRVKSLLYATRCSQVQREKILKVSEHNGYLYVTLHKSKKQKTLRVHRLVASAFITNNTGKPCVNHINGNKKDNRLENLEWCTHKENSIHAWETGLQNRVHKKNNAKSKCVIQYSAGFQFIQTFPSVREASRQTRIHSGAISRAAKTGGKAGNFIWKYK